MLLCLLQWSNQRKKCASAKMSPGQIPIPREVTFLASDTSFQAHRTDQSQPKLTISFETTRTVTCQSYCLSELRLCSIPCSNLRMQLGKPGSTFNLRNQNLSTSALKRYAVAQSYRTLPDHSFRAEKEGTRVMCRVIMCVLKCG